LQSVYFDQLWAMEPKDYDAAGSLGQHWQALT